MVLDGGFHDGFASTARNLQTTIQTKKQKQTRILKEGTANQTLKEHHWPPKRKATKKTKTPKKPNNNKNTKQKKEENKTPTPKKRRKNYRHPLQTFLPRFKARADRFPPRATWTSSPLGPPNWNLRRRRRRLGERRRQVVFSSRFWYFFWCFGVFCGFVGCFFVGLLVVFWWFFGVFHPFLVFFSPKRFWRGDFFGCGTDVLIGRFEGDGFWGVGCFLWKMFVGFCREFLGGCFFGVSCL